MLPLIELKRCCPVCQYPKGRLLHSQGFALPDDYPLPDRYDVVACGECGFCFADTSATQTDYDHYYASLSKYADVSTSTGGGSSPWDRERLCKTAAQIGRFETDLQKRILDMGCANGGLLAELATLGFQHLAGSDPSSCCVAHTRRLSHAEAWTGTLFSQPESAGTFHGILLSHVLEHVRDLREAMLAVRSLLEPSGWIYVEVPDAMRYGDFLTAPFQEFNTEHINHFSLPALSNLMAVSGFKVEGMGTKTILSSMNMLYPAIWMFARSSYDHSSIQNDLALAGVLENYVKASSLFMNRIDQRLATLLPLHDSWILWGAGQLTYKLLSQTCLSQARITAWVDGNPVHHGKTWRGITIQSPESLRDSHSPILIASLINQEAILTTLHRLELSNPLFTLQSDACC